MNTFTSCGLPWYPPPDDGLCPCDPDQFVRVLFDTEKDGRESYVNRTHPAKNWAWWSEYHEGWYPVNPDGTEIKKPIRPRISRPRVIRRRFKLKTR